MASFQDLGKVGLTTAEQAKLDRIVLLTGDPNGLISGSVGTIGIDTSTPALWQNQDGSTTWTNLTGGGGGTGAVEVRDEDGVINVAARILNFVGAEVQVEQDPGDPDKVNIFIPTPEYVSGFNNSNGTNSGIIFPQTVTTLRNVSQPTTEGNPFKLGSFSAGSSRPVTEATTWNIGTTEPFSIPDTDTKIRVQVLDADETTILAVSEVNLTGNTNTTVNNITIAITGFSTDINQFKAVASVTIDMTSIAAISSGGKVSVRIQHLTTANAVVAGSVTYIEGPYFIDVNDQAFTLGSLAIGELVPITKSLSGISYYNFGSSFSVNISDIDFVNKNSFTNPIIDVDIDQYAISDFSVNTSELTGYTLAHDAANLTFTDTKIITILNQRTIGNAQASATPQDFIPGTTIQSPAQLMLIDTYQSESNELAEFFTDEDFRKTSFNLAGAYTAGGVWDSSQSLLVQDGGNGLIIQDGLLKKADLTDWSVYLPSGNPNYTTRPAGFSPYYRQFLDVSSQVRGNARITLAGSANIVNQVVAGNVRIWFYIPNRWFVRGRVHGGDLFDFGTFNTAIINGSVYDDVIDVPIKTTFDNSAGTIDVSFGSFGLNAANNVIKLHLEISDPSIEISSFVLSF